MKIFAHRGASSSYPENTLAAFQEAFRLLIEGIELDVHLTKDRKLVVIHDETIDRTSNGSGYVKEMTLAELHRFDYGSWFSPQFKGEEIPTLTEVFELFRSTHHRINLELKTDIIQYEGIEELVLKEIEAYQLTERVIISSFDHEILQRVVKLAPTIEVAALFSNILVELPTYAKQIPVTAMHVSLPFASRKGVKQAVEEGLPIRVYTVNKIENAVDLEANGIEAIFTDEPEKMLNYFLKS